MVDNHGDRSRPLRIGLWDPLPNGRTSWLINGGWSQPLTSPGMVLQVRGCKIPYGVNFLVFLPTKCGFQRE